MKPPDRLYHASSVQGLSRLVPSASTHGIWVHAVADPVLAACFLSTTGGDLTCAVGRDRRTGIPYLCERFAGAFDRRYAGKPGSIYGVSGERFLAGVRIAIGTDAHRPGYFDDLRLGVATARRGWATSADVLDTLPPTELLATFG